MSLHDLTLLVEEKGKGVRAYVACMQLASERLEEETELSCAYFILKYAAGKFVHAFDDQPLLSSRAEEEFDNFKHYVEKLSKIEAAPDAATKFKIINQVATEIANHKLLRSVV